MRGFHSLPLCEIDEHLRYQFSVNGLPLFDTRFYTLDDVAYRRMEGTNMITIMTVSIGMNR